MVRLGLQRPRWCTTWRPPHRTKRQPGCPAHALWLYHHALVNEVGPELRKERPWPFPDTHRLFMLALLDYMRGPDLIDSWTRINLYRQRQRGEVDVNCGAYRRSFKRQRCFVDWRRRACRARRAGLWGSRSWTTMRGDAGPGPSPGPSPRRLVVWVFRVDAVALQNIRRRSAVFRKRVGPGSDSSGTRLAHGLERKLRFVRHCGRRSLSRRTTSIGSMPCTSSNSAAAMAPSDSRRRRCVRA